MINGMKTMSLPEPGLRERPKPKPNPVCSITSGVQESHQFIIESNERAASEWFLMVRVEVRLLSISLVGPLDSETIFHRSFLANRMATISYAAFADKYSPELIGQRNRAETTQKGEKAGVDKSGIVSTCTRTSSRLLILPRGLLPLESLKREGPALSHVPRVGKPRTCWAPRILYDT